MEADSATIEIVECLKQRFLQGDTSFIHVNKIVCLLNLQSHPHLAQTLKWLMSGKHKNVEAQGEMLSFKPPLRISGEQTLLKALMNAMYHGGGAGLLRSDIEASMIGAHRILKELAQQDKIRIITNPDREKSEVIFYNAFQKFDCIKVSEDLRSKWRTMMSNLPTAETIDRTLENAGLHPIPDTTKKLRWVPMSRKKRRARGPSKKKRPFKDNPNIADLVEYCDKPI